MKAIYLWAKMKQLIAVNQKNKQNRILCSILQFHWKIYFPKLTGKFQLLPNFTSRLEPVNTN